MILDARYWMADKLYKQKNKLQHSGFRVSRKDAK
jgi:hypothetical protein